MNWVTILKTNSNIEAEMLVNSLENQGLEAVLINKQVSGYPIIGFVEVKVLEEFKLKAEKLMAAEVQ